MSDVKILVACHKDTALLKSNVLLPIQVGAAQGKKKLDNMLMDNTDSPWQRKAGEYACGRYRRKYIRKKSDVL